MADKNYYVEKIEEIKKASITSSNSARYSAEVDEVVSIIESHNRERSKELAGLRERAEKIFSDDSFKEGYREQGYVSKEAFDVLRDIQKLQKYMIEELEFEKEIVVEELTKLREVIKQVHDVELQTALVGKLSDHYQKFENSIEKRLDEHKARVEDRFANHKDWTVGQLISAIKQMQLLLKQNGIKEEFFQEDPKLPKEEATQLQKTSEKYEEERAEAKDFDKTLDELDEDDEEEDKVDDFTRYGK